MTPLGNWLKSIVTNSLNNHDENIEINMKFSEIKTKDHVFTKCTMESIEEWNGFSNVIRKRFNEDNPNDITKKLSSVEQDFKQFLNQLFIDRSELLYTCDNIPIYTTYQITGMVYNYDGEFYWILKNTMDTTVIKYVNYKEQSLKNNIIYYT